MPTFDVPDMTCGHCKAGVEAALARLDPAARVAVDLTARRVAVETRASDAEVVAALEAAGFAAVAV
jgi:copper chaperone